MMINIPDFLFAFTKIPRSRGVGKVFCVHCEHESAETGISLPSSDGRAFVAYRIGKFLLVRISKGRGKCKWVITDRGGVVCEKGHFTGIHHGRIISERYPSERHSLESLYQMGDRNGGAEIEYKTTAQGY